MAAKLQQFCNKMYLSWPVLT